jgi:hypothetical protein
MTQYSPLKKNTRNLLKKERKILGTILEVTLFKESMELSGKNKSKVKISHTLLVCKLDRLCYL